MQNYNFIKYKERLIEDQWVIFGHTHNGMFARTRPSGDRKVFQYDKKDDTKYEYTNGRLIPKYPTKRPQVFMTFNAVRTLMYFKPDGWDYMVERASQWAERLLKDDGALVERIEPDDGSYSVNQFWSEKKTRNRIVNRHTFGLACILILTKRRYDLVEGIVNIAINGKQNSDGGWPVFEDEKESISDVFTSLWALTLFRLVLDEKEFLKYGHKVQAMLENTIAYFVNTNRNGYWTGNDVYERFWTTCDILPDLSDILKNKYPQTLSLTLSFLMEQISDNDFKKEFSSKLDPDQIFRTRVRLAYVLGTGLTKSNSQYHNIYLSLRNRIVNENIEQIELNTYDICRLFFLIHKESLGQGKVNSSVFGFNKIKVLYDALIAQPTIFGIGLDLKKLFKKKE